MTSVTTLYILSNGLENWLVQALKISLLKLLYTYYDVTYLSGYFFKISYVMKDYHKILTEDYKFSTWVSYAFFTLITILVGGLLGLVSFRNIG